MKSGLVLVAALSLSSFSALAAQQPAASETSFTVLRAGHLVGASLALTAAEANCAITGSGDAAAMKCSPLGVTQKNAYNYWSALVADPQGNAYIIACRNALVGNFWCKSFGGTRALRGRIANNQLVVADGDKTRNYLVLASRNVGPVSVTMPPPAAPAPAAPAAAAPTPPSATSSRAPAPPAADSSAASCAAGYVGACLTITSDPSGADIYVDGKFVGNTPSLIVVPAGARQIRVEAPNRKPWTRSLEATAGSRINLRATLEAAP